MKYFSENQVNVCLCAVCVLVCVHIVLYKQVSMLDICVIAVGYGGIRNTF